MKSLMLIILTLAVPMFAGTADAQLKASVLPDSRLVIEGRSTVSGFECDARTLKGSGTFQNGQAGAKLVVPVSSFDCGMSRMNRDFHEAMDADDHPEIVFELADVEATGRLEHGSHLIVKGRLSIAGTTREVRIQAQAEQVYEGLYRVRGERELFMTDFGIEPPTALAGLVRTQDRINVRFDLLAATTEPAHRPSTGQADGAR